MAFYDSIRQELHFQNANRATPAICWNFMNIYVPETLYYNQKSSGELLGARFAKMKTIFGPHREWDL